MNQKSPPKRKTPKKQKAVANLPVVEEPVELSGADKILAVVQPHATTIALAVVAGFIGFAAIAFLIRASFDTKSREWRDLNTASTVAYRINDISGLKEVADAYPESTAGLWAAQMAADFQLRMGVQQLTVDRDKGLELVKKSVVSYESIMEAPESAKTPMLQLRAQFGLAYALETLGEFEQALKVYSEFVDANPDSSFAAPARRGMERTKNKDFVSLYSKFTDWDESLEVAPGVSLPEQPNIDFPSFDQTGENSAVDLTKRPTTDPPSEPSGEDKKLDQPSTEEPQQPNVTTPVEATEKKDVATDPSPAPAASNEKKDPPKDPETATDTPAKTTDTPAKTTDTPAKTESDPPATTEGENNG